MAYSPKDAGLPTPVGNLYVTVHGDFEWTYHWGAGDFPPGVQLYYLVGDTPGEETRFDYVISGGTASIHIESEAFSGIEDRTGFYLMFKDGVKDFPVLMGLVRKGVAKR
ncbi:LtfC-like domain-containing protein [Antrihabitans cavernicola]|uniref:LtfC/p132/Gp6 beta-sandwich domain-containing protein n=1 Tax=Antrihabitans cavernicola TaxID=2495913 RepID=A0A5A7S5A7_9NOCA|nr:hypothetical protein [Spelaeibacter cavernicola]KAA0016757.1 hypothetical protein FOY51_25765 [Spelaeibacter cavernicola]